MLNNCRAGKHNLKEIYIVFNDWGTQDVVRWCSVCGSIVIDLDGDGRTSPGHIMKMTSPDISKM